MAKDKSLGPNPVQKHNKKAKQAVINKSRNERSKQRDEQLQKRRPDQVQRQIDELCKLQATGKITSHDVQLLKSLERDLNRIHKLRAENKNQPVITSERMQNREKHESTRTRIPKDPTRSYYYDPIYNPFGVAPPGMEDRDIHAEGSESDDSTASSTARIPLPVGIPPVTNRYDTLIRPNKAYRAPLQGYRQQNTEALVPDRASDDSRARPLQRTAQSSDEPLCLEKSQVTYSAAPVVRNLREESTVFIPKAIKRRLGDNMSTKEDPLAQYTIDDSCNARNSIAVSTTADVNTSMVAKTKRRLNLAPAIT